MKKRGMSRRDFLKITSATAFGATICGFPGIIPAAPKEILVGAVHPLSGMVAEAGGMAAMGLELAVEQVNKRGGIKSMGGASLKLLVEDSESKVEVGGIAAEKLIQKGVVCLVGAFQNDVTNNIARIAERHQIPLVIDISNADEITRQGFKYVFRIFPTISRVQQSGIPWVMEITKQSAKPLRTGVLMHISDITGKLNMDLFTNLVKEKGEPWKILKRISYPPNPISLASEVREAKDLKPDALFATCRLRDAILLVEEMYKHKFDVEGLFGVVAPGFADPSFHKLGKLSDCAYNICPWHDEVSEFARKVAQDYEAKFKKPFNMNSAHSYDAIMVIADSLERAGSVEKDQLRNAIVATKLKNKTIIGGPIEFDEYGDNKGARAALVQIQGGKPKVVLPEDAATSKAIFPVPPWDKRA